MKILQLFAKVIIFTEIIEQEESTRNFFLRNFEGKIFPNLRWKQVARDISQYWISGHLQMFADSQQEDGHANCVLLLSPA